MKGIHLENLNKMERLTRQQKLRIIKDLFETVKEDHPEFLEENTTGNDLLVGAKRLMKELTDTSFDSKLECNKVNGYSIGDKVKHPSDNCPFVVTGVAVDKIRIKGDWSGGVRPENENGWVCYDEIMPWEDYEIQKAD
jgi:hypothetical protein